MRIEGLIRMLIFRYGFKFLRKGASRLARPKDEAGNPISNKDLSPEQRKKLKSTEKNTGRAAKAARMASKIKRF